MQEYTIYPTRNAGERAGQLLYTRLQKLQDDNRAGSLRRIYETLRQRHVEVCEEADATQWSVYQRERLPSNDRDPVAEETWLADCNTHETARLLAIMLYRRQGGFIPSPYRTLEQQADYICIAPSCENPVGYGIDYCDACCRRGGGLLVDRDEVAAQAYLKRCHYRWTRQHPRQQRPSDPSLDDLRREAFL
ncbi:MAG: hypothetical protein ACYTG3_19970 [Planctomycetota bacterium]|jgi:hypothetical protein